MLDPKTAARTVDRLRYEMIKQVAEMLYDHMDFQDYESFETMRVHMRGTLRIIRRKE